MAYWRMQLHPGDSENAIKHSIDSLTAGFIGLDFSRDIGDLSKKTRDSLPINQHDYWDFANVMEKDDTVLIIAHHFPFALVTVDGRYNYIKRRAPELGVWFRHFRRVKDVKFFADYITDAHSWQRLTMTDTISRLIDSNSSSYQLIVEWNSA